MANTVTSTLHNTATNRRYVMTLTIIGDGSGEETATRVNVTSGDLGLKPRLVSISGSLAGFSARLLWDATTDVFAHQIPSDHMVKHNYHRFGGLPNTAGAGVTGDLLITTAGLGNGDSGSLVLEFITGN